MCVKRSSNIGVRALRTSPLWEVWLPGLRANLELVQLSAAPFLWCPWRKAPRQHSGEAPDRPEPAALDLKLRLYQYITWATYCSCCITALYVVGHESHWSGLWPIDWFPSLASAWPCHHLRLYLTLVAFTRPDPGPHLWADGPSWPRPFPKERPDA